MYKKSSKFIIVLEYLNLRRLMIIIKNITLLINICKIKSSLLLATKMLNELGQGERRSVGSGGNESSENGLCECGVSSAGQESEQLHTKH